MISVEFTHGQAVEIVLTAVIGLAVVAGLAWAFARFLKGFDGRG